MASYSLEVSAAAEEQLKKLARQDQIRVLRCVRALAEEPLPRGCRKLRGYENVFRVRVGTYRILYSLQAERLVVLVLKIGQRKSVHR